MHSCNTLGASGGRLRVDSIGNVFEGNWTGIEATGGVNLGMPNGPINNQYELHSLGDRFRWNTQSLYVAGMERDNPVATPAHDNQLDVHVVNARFDDADALHAWSVLFVPTPDDVNNRVNLDIRGSVRGPDSPAPRFLLIDTVPGDSNVITLTGNDTAFAASNGVAPTRQQYLVPPNPFDLAHTSLRFTPAGAGYKVTAGNVGLDLGSATPITFDGCWPTVGGVCQPLPYAGDDDTHAVVKEGSGFQFPFEGHAWSSIWVNADGNITLGEGDASSEARDVNRLVGGPPRIAPFLADIATNLGGQVLASLRSDRLVITWLSVPTSMMNLTDANTFQAVLHTDGTIDFVYGDIGAPAAVVGLSGGGGTSTLTAVDLSHASGQISTTLYEDFVGIVGP